MRRYEHLAPVSSTCRVAQQAIVVAKKAVDCCNAGVTVLHVQLREADGKDSRRMSVFNAMLDRQRTAVQKLVLQSGF